MPYVQEYLKTFGERKCEANAIVPMPKEAKKLVEDSIISFVGDNAVFRFNKKMDDVKEEMDDIRIKTGLKATIKQAIELIEDNE